MAVIGRAHAVADLFGRVRLSGFLAFATWGIVHLAYLAGSGSRVEAVARWMWTILARNRRERLISIVSLVGDDDARRQLAEELAASAADSGAPLEPESNRLPEGAGP